MAALNANNSLAQASKAQQKGMQKLASGFKINSAADDASGLAITEKMKNQIKALDTAKDNCEDGSNLIQTAEGYMAETHDMLTRMTELAEKAANGTLGDEDRKSLQKEMDQLCGEIDRIATTANFNGHKLLDGSIGSKAQVKVKSTENGFEYKSPDAASSKSGNHLGGGIASFTAIDTANASVDPKKYENADVKDGMTFQVSTASTASTDLDKATLKVKSKNADGTLGANELDMTIKAQVGDTVTIDKDGNGTSTNGLAFSNATKNAGGTFTYKDSGTTDANGNTVYKWMSDNNVEMDASTKMAAGGTAGKTEFTYSSSAAEDADNGVRNGINLQIGESSTSADRLNVSINSFHTDSLFGGLEGLVNKSNNATDDAATSAVKITKGNESSTYKNAVTIDISDKNSASAAADAIRQISNYVSDERGKLGAQQNRLEHTVNNLTTASENTTAAKSRILDTDMAKEMMAYTSKNVIAQAAQSMLAQANSQPQNVLSLLQ